MKQIMVVGAGSVGGFFGAHLAKHNPNVSFLLRPRTSLPARPGEYEVVPVEQSGQPLTDAQRSFRDAWLSSRARNTF